jgi:hypothetical protein
MKLASETMGDIKCTTSISDLMLIYIYTASCRIVGMGNFITSNAILFFGGFFRVSAPSFDIKHPNDPAAHV